MNFTFSGCKEKLGNVTVSRTHCCLNTFRVLLLRRKKRMDIRQITSSVCYWPLYFPFHLHLWNLPFVTPLATPWIYYNLSNFLSYFCVPFSLFHKSTICLLYYPYSLFPVFVLVTYPKVLHLYHFDSILNLSYHPLFSLIVAQLCSLIPQSLTLYIFLHLIQMLSGPLVLCDLENISLWYDVWYLLWNNSTLEGRKSQWGTNETRLTIC